MKKNLWILTLSLTIAGTNARAGAGTSTADFLKVSPDSRSAALGNTGTADPENGFAAFHNPALAAAASTKMKLSAGQTQGLLGAQVSHYAAAGRWEAAGGSWGLAAIASQWSTPSFDTTDGQGNTTGRSSFKAQTFGASLSRAWGNLAAGAGVKKITQGFDGGIAAKSSALAWDAGTYYRGGNGHWAAGAALTNAGKAAGLDGAADRLPTAAQAGLEVRPGDGQFAWTLEAAHTREKAMTVNAGMGFRPLPNLTLRAGYDGRTAGAKYAGLSSGVGISLGNLTLDYAFAPFGAMGNVQRVSVSWAIGGDRAEKAKKTESKRGYHNVRNGEWNGGYWGRP